MARLSAQGVASTEVQQSPTQSLNTTSENANDGTVPPFFNTTFSTHRVSPMHIGKSRLTNQRLQVIASRLRDTLVGDVVRGIQLRLEAADTSLGQVGALNGVRIEWFHASTFLGEDAPDFDLEAPRGDQSDLPDDQKQGLWISIEHENAAYAAILLPGLSDSSESRQMNDKNWLAASFDCRVSRVTMGTKTILGVWESWVANEGLNDRGIDFTITLAFNMSLQTSEGLTAIDKTQTQEEALANPGLRSVDITISAQDLRRFVRAGEKSHIPGDASWQGDARERRRLAGGNTDDGWAWRTKGPAEASPFTEALGLYLHHHLALNLFHPSVHVTQISCAGFVLGQSRLKIIMPGEISQSLSRAAWSFVAQLGQRVQGEQLPQVFVNQPGV
ncbi:kinetochore complex Sim4 subunit Fta1-domain-containing protein [Fusarium redolens]|uniref:Kinetochore complex Sim4 subunit Fta1-domain-containing protein n=1 Tax=Fusarium redolens TaxID=48865 RepID=A0A9P9GLG9_FUSRE|nr:kinetochore complex Sim4 subunit Fta1-domain-containing protein [Fusarium redolens]KAH7241131.1 kinetochore complex Sim4 subunit Fta1-domain-containing protein [Fusarium redolens]